MAPLPPINENAPPHDRRQASGGRRSSERAQIHFVALVEYANDAIIGETLDGRIASWNPAAERIFGYAADEIIGRPISVLIPPEQQAEAQKMLEYIRRGAVIDHYETTLRRKDGARAIISLTVSPIKDSRGRVIGASKIARDVTEIRAAEERLRTSEARYRTLFESSRDAIISSDMQGRLTGANPAAIGMLGYTLDELRRLTYQQLTPPRWHEMESAIVREQIVPRGYSNEYEKEYIRKDGSIVPVSVCAWLTTDHDGQSTGMWVLARDITERKRAEERLRENQARWQSLFENAPVAIWEEDFSAVRARFDELRREGVEDLNGYLDAHPEETRRLVSLVEVLDMSRATSETFRVSSLAELPRSLLDYVDTGSLAVFARKFAALWAGRRRFAAEIRIRHPAGQPLLLDARLSVVPGFERSLARVLVSFMDITQRRGAEESVRESEHRFRALAEGMPHIVWETDFTGKVLYQNQVWRDYTRRESALGCAWLGDLHPEDRDYLLAEWNESTGTEGAHPYDIEVRLRRHDGVYRWFRVKGAPIKNGAGKVVRWAGTCTDIEDQKRATERLEFAQVAGGVGFFDYDFATDQSVWSEGLARLFDVDLKSYEKTWAAWAKRMVPKDFARVRAKVQERIRRRAPRVDFEFRAVQRDGSHRWLAGRARLIYDGAGKPLRMIGMNVDISERKRLERELEQRARELADADRRKDEFLATLAHELRNPLASIRTSAEIIRRDAGTDARLQWAGDAIGRQVRHLGRLVGDLLDLAAIAQGKVSLRMEPCDLRVAVAQAVEMNRHAAEAKHLQLNVDLPDAELPLRGDTARLVQVVSNLLGNSVKYTPAGGRIDVDATRADGSVVLRVRDTGIGIDAELLPHVFELFVQGKRDLARADGGLGIGLTLVKRITELHGGHASVASGGPDQGAEFTVRLPLSGIPLPRARPPSESATGRRTGTARRILIVEDNEDAAESLAFLLRDMGHEVQVAYEGCDGLAKALALPPDVAVIDIGLPGISGYDLARRFREEPHLRDALLVAMSGYGQWSDREKSRAAGFDHHLIKPADLGELDAILAERRAES